MSCRKTHALAGKTLQIVFGVPVRVVFVFVRGSNSGERCLHAIAAVSAEAWLSGVAPHRDRADSRQRLCQHHLL